MRKRIITISLFYLLFPLCGLTTAETPDGMVQPKEEIMLDETVIVATREEEDIIRIPGNVSVITSDDIERSTAKEISDILRKESGIMVTNTSGSTPTGITVEFRGFNNGGGNGGRTLVLIDGWKVNQADTSSPDWASIPLDNIERVEIIRGPATAIYGDIAMAGVINIITKSGSGKADLNIGVDAGSWQRFGKKITFQGAADKFTYYLYGNHGTEGGYRDNSDFSNTALAAKFSYQLNPTIGLSANLRYHDNNRKRPGALTETEISTVGRRGTVTPLDEVETDQINFGLGVDIILNDHNKFSAKYYFNNSERDALTSIPGTGSTSAVDDERNQSLSLRYALNHTLWGMENKVITGVDLLDEEVDSTSFSNYPGPWPWIQRQNTDYDRELIGVYIHDSLSITDRIIFDVGVRYDRGVFDYQNTTEDLVFSTVTRTNGDEEFEQYSPKAAITYLFSNDASTYFSYARTFRFPNRDELTGFWGFTPQLDPEKGENYEIGLKIRLRSEFNFGMSVFHMKVEDEILYQPPATGAFAFGQNENFEEVIHEGIEVSLDSSVLPRTMIYATYTYTDTEIEKGPFKGSEMPITPRHMGSISAMTDLGGGVSLWNQARFVGKRYLANDLANAMDKLPAYNVWDMNLSYAYKGRFGTFSAYCGINNLLDEEYTENGGIGGFPFGSRVGIYPSPERHYVGGVNIKMQF